MVGAPYVCSYPQGDVPALLQCVHLALTTTLEPLVLPQFTVGAHTARVRAAFDLR